MPEHDEAAPDGLIDSLQLYFRCDHTVDDHVNERSQRRRDANAVDGFDIRLAEVGTMQTQHSRNCGGTRSSNGACVAACPELRRAELPLPNQAARRVFHELADVQVVLRVVRRLLWRAG